MLPRTTLFLLQSLDGKISTGSTDERDVDKDFPNIPYLKEGLHQYYEREQETDLWSLNTGRVFAKVGINTATAVSKTPVNFVVIDNTHLTKEGVTNVCKKSNQAFIVTSNSSHPAYSVLKDKKVGNLTIIF